MKHTFNLVLIAGLLLSLLAGVGGSPQNTGQAFAQVEAPATPKATLEFQILDLSAEDYAVVDHDAITGDDRGGIATSNTQVFYSGDDATGRFSLDDLSGGTSLGETYDTMVSDLMSGQVYLLGTADAPIPTYSGDQTVAQLLLVDGDTGSLTGDALDLDPTFTLNTDGYQGIFAGYGRVVVYDASLGNTWSIDTATGAVTSLPNVSLLNYYGCENWAFWGMAEHFGGEDYLVYRGDTGEEILRTRLSDGDTSVVASFTDLSDMCSLSANLARGRWYFHYEGSGQFGGSSETVGYAAARFQTTSGFLDGNVYDSVTLDPIPGATVSADYFSADTDNSGYYTMTVAVGMYDGYAEHPQYTTDMASGLVIVTDTVTTQDFYLVPRGLVYGNVTDFDNGFPLAATISADDGSYVDTDPLTGAYELYLDEGTYVITATAKNYASGVATISITSGEEQQENFVLQADVSFIPSPVNITLDWQTTGSLDATLLNRLASTYDFEFFEKDEGFEPLAYAEGMSGRLLMQAGWIALVSDDSTLTAVTPILDSMGLTYDVVNDNDPNLYMADPAFLSQYDLIVWYQSGSGGSGREITQAEHDAVEAWLQAGGNLLVTGYDSLGSPDDPLLADLVRSSTYGDDARGYDFEILIDHPITNGPFGVYPPGTVLTINNDDHDDATADTARGAVAVATIDSDPYDKIIATELASGGVVVYWNGNEDADDWLDVPIGNGLPREDKGVVAERPGYPASIEGQNMFKNTLAWLALSREVPWLGQVPISGTVGADNSLDVTLQFTATFDAGIYQPGDYYATLIVDGAPQVNVPVVMTVLAPGNMGKVEGTILDNCSGEPVEAMVTFSAGNPITYTMSDPDTGYYAAWLVEGSYDLTFTAGGYITATDSVIIVAGETQTIDVDLVPDHPCMSFQPEDMEVWLVTGTVSYGYPTGLDIINNGGEDLDFEILERSESGGMLQSKPIQLFGKVKEFFEQKLPGDSVAGYAPGHSGGPDPFGYTFADSSEPGGPIYEWIEIAPPAGGSGTSLGMNDTDDGYYWPLDLPFPFNFYGTDYTQMAVASNGTLYFEDVYLGYSNTSLPNTTETVLDFIAHFWDDMYIQPGEIYYQDMGYKFILEYYQVAGCCDSSDYGTWQIILYNNGSILFQYQDVDFADTEYDNGTSATVGIQSFNTDPTYYLEYSYNTPVITPDLAICFAHPSSSGCGTEDVPWVWEDPISGTVPALGMANVDVTFTALYTDSTPMLLGDYLASLVVTSNDRYANPLVPLTMHIVDQFVDPVPSFTSDTLLCFGEATTFTNTSVDGVPPVDHFVWDFGDGETLTVEDFDPVSHSYAAAGTYEVTLTAVQKQTGAEFTYTQTVDVLQPVADFTYEVSGLSVAFTNNSSDADTFLWDFGDGETSTGASPVHMYAEPGTYEVSLTATGGCGVGIKTENITVDLYKVYQPSIFKAYTLP